jgi:hypothetical protein
VRKNADPQQEIGAVAARAQAEIKRVNS